MQGRLQEIDIRSILQLIELGQRTGELFVEARPSIYWFVFFLNGRIIYASETEGHIARLKDYLRRFKLEAALDEVQIPPKAAVNAPEYNRLWSLLENHKLNPSQGKQILLGMVREVLFDLLSLHQGSFIFEAGSPLAPQLTTFPVTPLLAEMVTQVQEWKKLHPYIQPALGEQAGNGLQIGTVIIHHQYFAHGHLAPAVFRVSGQPWRLPEVGSCLSALLAASGLAAPGWLGYLLLFGEVPLLSSILQYSACLARISTFFRDFGWPPAYSPPPRLGGGPT